MSDQLRRNLNVECRVLNEADGLVEYVASDATLDSYLESILSDGWRFTHFSRNAPFVDSHNYYSIENLLGRVTSAKVEGGKLIETVMWAKNVAENKLASLGWKMTVGGFLKAVSVGFRVVKSAYPHDTGWNGYVAQAGLSADDAAKCRRIFVEQEQLELSACILGANPAAVAKAYDAKCIGEADLAGVGLSEDDMIFLTVAGAASEKDDCTEVMRMMIRREIHRMTARRVPGTPSTSTPGMPDGGDEVRRLAAERADFLRQLESVIR